MHSYIRSEFKRALINKYTFLAIIVGIISMIIGCENYLFNNTFNMDAFFLFSFAYSSGTSSILIILAPLLVALPFSSSCLEEMQSNFYENVFTRMTRKKYLISKILINGVSGGLTIVIILLISFFIFILNKGFYSSLDLLNSLDLSNTSLYLYNISPFLYVFFIIITSFFGGFTFSTIALSVSTIIKNKYLALISPFILNALTGVFLEPLNKLFYTVNFFNVTYYDISLINIFLYEFIVTFIFIIIFLERVSRWD